MLPIVAHEAAGIAAAAWGVGVRSGATSDVGGITSSTPSSAPSLADRIIRPTEQTIPPRATVVGEHLTEGLARTGLERR
jgi:hypothetical protein